MADPVDEAVSKVEAAAAEVLRDYAALSAWSILTDQPIDVAIEGDDILALVIRTMGPDYDNSFEPGAQTLNTLTLDVEAVAREAGVIKAKRAREGLAHALTALAADRTLGGMLQDMQEIDAATGDGQRRDISAISLQFRLQYLTARGNPFTILGHAGASF
ncbi:hypothetical protein SZ64_04405 [Erythrobacter sp. SG61-1L]|uniref:hypothetical protein n=1 Tax=Erythrobacter sp. SG61-1L TaxID=1603897 RepID=UPI0006C9081E|nr:hypothetical protein [Erythrobacter sp. SG61-1L]KPL67412.1 hypothetical protein SZ64_04405 [Erythrobacter sp. SG61-1L]